MSSAALSDSRAVHYSCYACSKGKRQSGTIVICLRERCIALGHVEADRECSPCRCSRASNARSVTQALCCAADVMALLQQLTGVQENNLSSKAAAIDQAPAAKWLSKEVVSMQSNAPRPSSSSCAAHQRCGGQPGGIKIRIRITSCMPRHGH